VLISGLGLFEHGSFSITNGLEGVGRGRPGTSTPPGRLPISQLEGPPSKLGATKLTGPKGDPLRMLTHGEDVEAHALRQRGWTISAIARHLNHDRKTVRAYLDGTRAPGVRARSRPDPLEPFVAYLAASLRGRPTRLGLRAPRRGEAPRLPTQLPELRPPGPPRLAPPALRGVSGGCPHVLVKRLRSGEDEVDVVVGLSSAGAVAGDDVGDDFEQCLAFLALGRS
jgi:hypothetical protein